MTDFELGMRLKRINGIMNAGEALFNAIKKDPEIIGSKEATVVFEALEQFVLSEMRKLVQEVRE